MSKVRFEAWLYEGRNGWVYLDLSTEASASLGKRTAVPVKVHLNGFQSRATAFPNGRGGHYLMVNKEMRAGASAETGDNVTVAIEVDNEPRTVEVPVELKKALSKSKRARAYFESLSPSHRKAYVEFILEAKRPETRERRVKQTIERLEREAK
ncbi:MAG TPA: YdeI/OmpD-associated family protein [Blastocatellia bacterium]|nr:YdeI/OmpD-associated family protein [Blastocatellia bacterium]